VAQAAYRADDVTLCEDAVDPGEGVDPDPGSNTSSAVAGGYTGEGQGQHG
jgi:hypothetical protein